MPVRRILLIDDDATVRDVVTCCLARTDYELDAPAVDRRHVSAAAMNTILNGRYDLLLLDLIASAPCPADLALRIGTERRPRRVDLLFGGWLSPVHLRRGDRLVSAHRVAEGLGRDLRSRGLRVGALRQSGARPEHADPVSIEVPLSR